VREGADLKPSCFTPTGVDADDARGKKALLFGKRSMKFGSLAGALN
jgi:hypothetical protein